VPQPAFDHPITNPPKECFVASIAIGTGLGTAKKILLSLSVLGAAGSIAALGTFAQFTSSTSASQSASAGTMTVNVGAAGTSANRLNVAVTDMAPGDTAQRALDLTNSGSIGLAGVTLSTAASPSSVLDTDAVNGLQVVIDRCSAAWTESASTPYTYSCGGTVSTVLASRPVIGSGLALANLGSTSPGGVDHLRVTLSLPTTADNSFQGASSTIAYTFTGTQRPGTAK
jgi:spore coat-associated protein N